MSEGNKAKAIRLEAENGELRQQLYDMDRAYKELRKRASHVFYQQFRWFLVNENELELNIRFDERGLDIQAAEYIKGVAHILPEVSPADAAAHSSWRGQ